MAITYELLEKFCDSAAKRMAEIVEYDIAWGISENVFPATTVYKGKGRPRRTDYNTFKHVFDGKLSRQIQRA